MFKYFSYAVFFIIKCRFRVMDGGIFITNHSFTTKCSDAGCWVKKDWR